VLFYLSKELVKHHSINPKNLQHDHTGKIVITGFYNAH